jgi:hypothetical protein
MTRAVFCTMHLEFARALKFHAFGPLFVLGALVFWAMCGIGAATGRDLLPDLSSPRVGKTGLAIMIAFMIYWIVRLATGTLPP